MNNPLYALTTRFKFVVIAAFIIITAIAAWFIQYFKIDASADTLLSSGNELYIQTQQVNQRFAPDEFVLLAYQPKGHGVFSEQTFDDIQQLADELSSIPRVASVTHILNVPLLSQASALQGDLDPQQWTWQNQQYSPQKMAEIFDQHPLFTDLLVNEKGDATAIQVVFKPDPELVEIDRKIVALQSKQLDGSFSSEDEVALAELKQRADPIREKIDQIRQQEIEQIYQIAEPFGQRANLYLGGAYVLGHELINIISADLKIFGSAIGIAICLLLLLFFRHIKWVIIPLLCCASSVVITMGLFGLLDLRTTVISSNFIALQLILTLAIVVHLIVQYRLIAQHAEQKATQSQLIRDTLAAKLKPCLYAGITTSVGFASLIFSGIQPVVSFGIMMIIAMSVSLLVSLLLFPALLSLFNRDTGTPEARFSGKLIDWVERLSLSQPKAITVTAFVVAGVSILGLLRLDVENSFLNYFKQDTRVHQQLSFIDREFGGSTPFDIIFDIPAEQQDEQLAITAEAMQTLQVLQTVLQQYPATGNVTSVHNFTELAVAINDGKPLTEYELTAIYRLVDKDLRQRLLGAYFDPDTQQLRISTRVQDTTEGLDRAEYLENLRHDFDNNGIEPSQVLLTNLFVLYQDILQRLFESQILTLGIVYVALFLVLWLLFRRLNVALIALIPNVLCTVFILAIMGIAGIPLDLMTITIAAIAMGIAVDDTIHFVHHYLQGDKKANQHSSEKALNHAFRHVGFAMLYTTSIIAIGFSLLGFSDFVPSMLFGLLTAAAMLIALVTDLTLLPVLLKRFVEPEKSTAIR